MNCKKRNYPENYPEIPKGGFKNATTQTDKVMQQKINNKQQKRNMFVSSLLFCSLYCSLFSSY